MVKRIYCSCNGKPCDGICREKHLQRKRTFLERCPAAYDVDENGKEIRRGK